MLHFNKSKIIFLVTTVIALVIVAFFRFYRLGSIPQGLTKDESYYGYDAYSILKTGRDIWGNKLPLSFKSTGEYKMNLTYFIVPAIKLFGLNEMSVRLPSAVFGFATLIVLFFTLNLIFSHRFFSLLMTTVFALSPLSFGMSRLFYESNVGLFFVAVGIYFVFSRNLLLASTFLAISSYLYNPYRYLGLGLLLIALVLTYLFRKRDPQPSLLRRLLPLIIFLGIVSPLLIFSKSGTTLNRLREELILQKTNYELVINDMRANCYLLLKSPSLAKLCYPLWNKLVLHLGNVAKSSLEPVSPEILFLETHDQYITPDNYGVFHSFLLPFYFLGLIWLFGFSTLRKLGRYHQYFLLFGLVLSVGIIAATGNVGIYRHPVTMYLIYLMICIGAFQAYQQISMLKKFPAFLIYLTLILTAGFQITKYLATYNLYTQKLPLLFSSDDREIFEYISSKKDFQYIVDRKFHSPLTASFFWAIDPAYFQQHIIWTDPDPWGFINAYRLGNIYSQTYTVEQLLCLKHQNPSSPLRAVVIDDPGKYNEYADLLTHDYTHSLVLHAVYDIDLLYPQVLLHFPADLCQLPK